MMEKRLVTDMIDFNQRVIEKFANLKERRATFLDRYRGLLCQTPNVQCD